MQVVIGLAILISVFIAIQDERSSLIASDWAIVVYLAWCSAATHLAGLTTLREYLGCRLRTKCLRVAAMFILLATLIIGMVPTGYFSWGLSTKRSYTAALPKSPVFCYFSITTARRLWDAHIEVDNFHISKDESISDHIGATKAMQNMIVGALLLVYSFANRCVRLSTRTQRVFIVWARQPVRSRARQIIASIM